MYGRAKRTGLLKCEVVNTNMSHQWGIITFITACQSQPSLETILTPQTGSGQEDKLTNNRLLKDKIISLIVSCRTSMAIRLN